MNFKPFIPAIIWLGIVVILSSYPGKNLPKAPFDEFDKLVHVAIYALLTFLVLLGFFKQPKHHQKKTTFAIGFAVSFSIIVGGLIEVLQEYVFINRYGDWIDFIANSIGAVVGVVGFWLLGKKYFV